MFALELWRLDKFIAFSGAASRREVRLLIKAGRIQVDGCTAGGPEQKIDPQTASVYLDGQRISFSVHVYLMMNKPAGVLSSTEDARDRTVLDLLPETLRKRGLFPAGRLDKDSEGLLLLTDDGDYCHRVISPRKNVFKCYEIETMGCPTPEDCAAVAAGMTLEDGTACRPGRLEILETGQTARCRIRISEGKFHQVKRMLAVLGKPVLSLRRTEIGALHLDENLKPGAYREMTAEEAQLALQTGVSSL